MKRREFIILLGGAATWPLAALAQQVAKIPRIGIIDDVVNMRTAKAIGLNIPVLRDESQIVSLPPREPPR